MTAARRAKRRPVKPPTASSVYHGSVLIGEVLPRRGGGFAARLTSGKRLGAFADERSAMRAITAAARAESTRATEAPNKGFNWQPGERVDGPSKTSKSKPARAARAANPSP
jgi:hypothetical protein